MFFCYVALWGRYYCLAGVATNRYLPCGNGLGNATVYCPEGSAFPLLVDSGSYSLGGPAPNLNSAQARCPVGSYCQEGRKVSTGPPPGDTWGWGAGRSMCVGGGVGA